MDVSKWKNARAEQVAASIVEGTGIRKAIERREAKATAKRSKNARGRK